MSFYHRPATLDEALVLLRDAVDMVVIAGGTDVYPARAARMAWAEADTIPVLDISALHALRGIRERDDCWHIGALTTWTDILRAPLPPLFDALKSAARQIGGVQIQNRGTIGGNCCTASPAGDSIPCLLALDAEFELTGPAQRRSIPAADFFTGYRRTALSPGEIVTGIRIPKQAGRSVFMKHGARRYLVISIVMVAAVLETDSAGRITSASIAVGACAATAERLPALERALVGQRFEPSLILPEYFAGLSPIDDIRASATYRLVAARELTRDAIALLARPLPVEPTHAPH